MVSSPVVQVPLCKSEVTKMSVLDVYKRVPHVSSCMVDKLTSISIGQGKKKHSGLLQG